MNRFFDSIEVIQHNAMMNRLANSLSKVTNEGLYRQLQSELLFHKKVINPALLAQTNLLHYEAAKMYIQAFDLAITHKCNGILTYHCLEAEFDKVPRIGCYNTMANLPQYTPGAVELEVIQCDGSGIKPEMWNLGNLMQL
jgi:hypothetical protein